MLMVSSVARLSFLVTLIVFVQGCNSGPSAPSEVGQPVAAQPAPTLPGMTRLTGTVVEPDGQAVSGAVITWLYGGQPSTAVTDATGVYGLTLDSQPPEVVRLTVEKDGFEPTVLFVAAEGKAEVRRDLHLHRIQRIPVGESVPVVGRPGRLPLQRLCHRRGLRLREMAVPAAPVRPVDGRRSDDLDQGRRQRTAVPDPACDQSERRWSILLLHSR